LQARPRLPRHGSRTLARASEPLPPLRPLGNAGASHGRFPRLGGFPGVAQARRPLLREPARGRAHDRNRQGLLSAGTAPAFGSLDVNHTAHHDPLSEDNEGKVGFALNRWIAIFTAIMATLAAITGHEASEIANRAILIKNEAVLKKTEAANQWAYYQ